MDFWLAIVGLGVPLSFACLLASCLVIKPNGWDRAGGLILSLVASSIAASFFLPGDFSAEEDDVANGMLVFIWAAVTFWFCVVAAICSLLLYTPARALADRWRGGAR